MDGISQVLKNLGAARLAVMAVVGVATIGFFMYMAARFSQPPMGLLYGELDLEDSSRIVERLDAANTPYELRGNGSEIFVPSDQVQRLRMTMAGEGLPSGGSIGYEIFDRSQSFGTTNFVQNVNRLRALEGELRRSIRTIESIENARVHLVLPKREVFARQQREPSASIVIKLRGTSELDRNQITGIQNLAAAAVPQLKPSRVAIIDSKGNLLARGDGTGNDVGSLTTSMDDARLQHERRVKHAIESLLEQTVGFGKVRAEVSAEMDFDRITTNSEIYDPDGQVVRSTQTSEESDSSTEQDSSGEVSVENNLPEADDELTDTSKSSANSARTEETVNFEISKTTTTKISEVGSVRRLSVAVLVDGTYTTDAQGNKTYQPRSVAELQSLTSLVRSAIGFDEERGDKVEIINLKFAQFDDQLGDGSEDGFLLGLTKGELFKFAEMGVLGLVAIMVLLLVIRPMLNRVLSTTPADNLAGDGNLALPGTTMGQIAGAVGAEGEPAMLNADGTPIAGALPTPDDGDGASEINVEEVESRVRESSLRKISTLVEQNPNEAVGIVRQWMYEEA